MRNEYFRKTFIDFDILQEKYAPRSRCIHIFIFEETAEKPPVRHSSTVFTRKKVSNYEVSENFLSPDEEHAFFA